MKLIFCTTSQWEGFPNALAEALAMAMPAIGYRSCAGVNQLIEHEKSGFLVIDSEEGFELSERIEQLILDQKLRREFTVAAAASMQAYHPEIVQEKWKKLVESV